ncbi:DUF6680 family protein [Variovorax sp. Sphag1AA]|uniref:DUF6680 family protein n=1 Tax=Variovorax sp. Sphag1AA TaxID=2587027 RepID=UPI001607AD88|nr:DUF6680 family protein [Variovorax sp. Sphag1AA]MBB3182400.1 hypothetical protein [Variovorax sp. Sphag1AA]
MTYDQMGLNEWLIIGATIVGPILAVQAQKWIERARVATGRRTWIFETLMATRGARMSMDHVRALNTIDLAFYGTKILGRTVRSRKWQSVIDAWHEYHAHLSQPEEQRPKTKDQDVAWGAKGEELFVNLLTALAVSNHYRFDRTQLRMGGYSPAGHATVENEQTALRNLLIRMLSGQHPLPVEVRSTAVANADAPRSGPQIGLLQEPWGSKTGSGGT